MRLHRLELRRYGHLSDVVLDLPADAALCVVHGVNEAGKSTALAAITDALFGFQDVRTGPRPDFLHGGPQLRVGITLSAQDGTRATLVRRKGRGTTLADEAGEPVAEQVMHRMLGGASRETWRDTFGLNGERLRDGGRALAGGGGSVGETLFSAATGLLHHRAALDRLDEAAKALVGRANADRVFNSAMDRWRRAQSEMDRLSIQPRTWIEADKAHTEAVADLTRLGREVEALRREESQLQRMRRLSPVLKQLDAARDTVAGLPASPFLPADAQALLQSHLTARDQAVPAIAQETGRAEELAASRDALVRAPSLLAAQDHIARLTERRGAIVQAEADLPGQVAEERRLHDRLAQAASDLGGLDVQAATEALPPAKARTAILSLTKRHAALAKDAAIAERERSAAQTGLEAAQRDLAAAPAHVDPGPLRQALDEARQEGRLDTELARAASLALAAWGAANAALSALPLWSGSLDGLASCKLPLPSLEEAVAETLRGAADRLTRAEAALAGAAEEFGAAEEQMAGFGAAASVPTPLAVEEARRTRAAAWQAVRNALAAGAAPGSLPPMLDRFERTQAEADRMADRRAEEAQRVALYLGAVQRLDVAREAHAGCASPLHAAQAAHHEAETGWNVLWSAVTDQPGPPAAMAEWRRARQAVLDLSKAAAEAEAARDDVARRREAAIASLHHHLPDLAQEAGLARAIAAGQAQWQLRDAAAAAHKTLAQAPGLAQGRLDTAEHAVREAGAALARWQRGWAPAMAALGLPPECPVDEAEASVAAWAVVAENAPAWSTARQRVTQMRQSIADFAADVDAAAAASGSPRPSSEPPLPTAARLARELAEALKVEAEHASLSQQVQDRRQDGAAAQKRHDQATAGIADLQAKAGAKDLPALETVLADARRRTEAEAAIATLSARLLAEGDGFDEPALRETAASYDPDTALSRLDEIAAGLRALDVERERRTADRTRSETVLATMHGAGAAADSAQDARHALADAAAAAERYGRLHLARELLKAGMARFRQGQQGPLLAAAGKHFATLTAGRYARLSVDEEKDGRTLLLAVRDDGSECPIPSLSEGTQDQLYLALRIAMVEAHAAVSEPLPFIADDLLVNFDDSRAAAAIRLLKDLGRTTQVILFSHHDHVAGLASKMEVSEVAVIRMPELGVAGQPVLEVGGA